MENAKIKLFGDLTYSYKQNLSVEKNQKGVEEIIINKVNYLCDHYFFSQNYSNDLVQLINKMNNALNDKISLLLDKDKNFLKFFNEMINIYNKFSNEIVKTKTLIKRDNQIQEKVIPEDLSLLIEKTQDNISSIFTKFSSSLQSNLKSPINKLNDVYNRLNTYHKESLSMIHVIEEVRMQIENKFNTKYGVVFDNILKNKNSPNILQSLLESNDDFILIEMELNASFNILYTEINKFLPNIKNLVSQKKILISEYLQYLKETIEIYIKENKKIFNQNLFNEFDSIQKFYQCINKEVHEISCTMNKIFATPEVLNSFNALFYNFHKSLTKFSVIDSNLLTENLFKAEAYVTTDDFFNFLINLNPKQRFGDYKILIDKEINVKRDPGLFKSWKNSYLIISRQKNILVFDESIALDKFVDILNFNGLIFRKKEDKKSKFRFELIQIKKGFLYDSQNIFLFDAESMEKYDQVIDIIAKNELVKAENLQ